MKDLQPKGDPRGASTSGEGHAGTESPGFRRIAKASVENQSPTWGLAVVGLATLWFTGLNLNRIVRSVR